MARAFTKAEWAKIHNLMTRKGGGYGRADVDAFLKSLDRVELVGRKSAKLVSAPKHIHRAA